MVAGARRPGGARPAPRGHLRPRRARRDAAEGRRLRGLPPAPRAQPRADHHAHRQGRGDRQGARPRARRRRLHHQALLGARVPQPREGGAAARRAHPRPRSSSRSRSRRATCGSTSRSGSSRCAARRCGSPTSSSRSSPRSRARPGGCSAARCCSSASGATPPTATRARSTSTSATCARSSSATRRRPSCIFTVRGVGYRFRDAMRTASGCAPATSWRCCSSRSRRWPSASSTSSSSRSSSRTSSAAPATTCEPWRGASAGDARAAMHGERSDAPTLDRSVRAVADRADARVTLLGWTSARRAAARPARLDVLPDSPTRASSSDVPERRTRSRRAPCAPASTQTGFGSFEGEDLGDVAQAARPLAEAAPSWVALYSRTLEEVDRDGVLRPQARALGRRRRAAGRAARRLPGRPALARRVRRDRARGARTSRPATSIEPLPVDSEDELGQLTRTFNEMQEQLRRVDVARKEFIATASHELRTPIFSLGGLRRAAAGRGPRRGDPRASSSTRWREQVERLQKLSVDLLDLSRLDAGSVELHTEPVDLGRAGALGRRRVPAGARRPRGPSSTLELPEEGPEASCDRERVAQIMRILLDNALRHTPEGTDVTVSARPRQRRRRVHGGRLRPGPSAEARTSRSSSASTPATRRAASGSASRSPASSPSGWTAGSCSTSEPGQHRVHARAAARTDRVVRAHSRRCCAALALAAAGSRLPRTTTTAAARRRRADARGHRPRASRWSRASARRAASTPARSTTGSRPASSRSSRSSAAPANVLEDGGEGGQGSGFVLDGEGYVATNAHVVTTRGRQLASRPSTSSSSSPTATACRRRSSGTTPTPTSRC